MYKRPQTRFFLINSERRLRSKKRKFGFAANYPKMAPPKERVSMKWTSATDLIFIDLCLVEVRKGNRPGTLLSKDGWKNVLKEFHSKTGTLLDQKQLKNRWDQMKREWSLYRNLRSRCTCLGWDASKNTIEASDEWWEEQIAANQKYKKFRGKDCSLLASKYDALFRGTVATGTGPRASTQPSCLEDSEPDAENTGEGSGDSDEIDTIPRNPSRTIPDTPLVSQPELFPPSPFEMGNNSGSKRKWGNVSSIKERIQSLLNHASTRSIEASMYVQPLTSPTIEECTNMLNGLEEVERYSVLYYFAASLFGKTGNRQIFMRHIDDRAHVGWLGFKYDVFLRGN